MPIIRSSRVLYKWLLSVVFGAVKMGKVNLLGAVKMEKVNLLGVNKFTFSIFTASNTTDSNHFYNTLEPLMMGIMVSETC
jgi:hypothetical protein